jgi:hypothetical protein
MGQVTRHGPKHCYRYCCGGITKCIERKSPRAHSMSVLLEIRSVAEALGDPGVASPAPVMRQTIVMHLPLLHNPNRFGIRVPIGLGKFRQTFRELKSQFSGFNVSALLGWCREDGLWDPCLRVDFDAEMTPDLERFLSWWREFLGKRFHQRSFHMSKSSAVSWVL